MYEDSASADEVHGSCSPIEALKRAKAEFDKAQATYHKLREEAAERVKSVRQTSVGDVIDGTLNVVRRNPGKSLAIATLLGLYLGRLLRR